MIDRTLRVLLVVLNLFLAITAIIGGLWVIPTLPREWLTGTPFSSFLIPALALALLVGDGALTAAIGLVFGRSWAPLVSMVTGAAIAIFEVVETVTLSLHFWLHTAGLESDPFTTASPIDLSHGIPIPTPADTQHGTGNVKAPGVYFRDVIGTFRQHTYTDDDPGRGASERAD